MRLVSKSYKAKQGEKILIHPGGNRFAFSVTHAYKLMIKKDNGGWKYEDKPEKKNADNSTNTGDQRKPTKQKSDKSGD